MAAMTSLSANKVEPVLTFENATFFNATYRQTSFCRSITTGTNYIYKETLPLTCLLWMWQAKLPFLDRYLAAETNKITDKSLMHADHFVICFSIPTLPFHPKVYSKKLTAIKRPFKSITLLKQIQWLLF